MKFKYTTDIENIGPTVIVSGVRHRLSKKQQDEICILIDQLRNPEYQNKFLSIPEYVDVFQKRKDGEVYYEIQIYN